jgi:hypothetical protein
MLTLELNMPSPAPAAPAHGRKLNEKKMANQKLDSDETQTPTVAPNAASREGENSGEVDDPQRPNRVAKTSKTCDHLREDGTFCASPAQRYRKYCYYHLRERARRLHMAMARSRREHWILDLQPLDTLASVQIAIMHVTQAVLLEHLDTHRANTILRGLNLMSSNLRQPEEVWEQAKVAMRPSHDDCVATRYDDVEEQFGLSETLDLDTPPEVAFPDPAPEDRTYQDLLHVTPLDIELAELSVKQGPLAVRERMQKATHAEQMAIRRKNEIIEHALRVVKAEARSAERYEQVTRRCAAQREIERHGWLPDGQDLDDLKKPPQSIGVAATTVSREY